MLSNIGKKQVAARERAFFVLSVELSPQKNLPVNYLDVFSGLPLILSHLNLEVLCLMLLSLAFIIMQCFIAV